MSNVRILSSTSVHNKCRQIRSLVSKKWGRRRRRRFDTLERNLKKSLAHHRCFECSRQSRTRSIKNFYKPGEFTCVGRSVASFDSVHEVSRFPQTLFHGLSANCPTPSDREREATYCDKRIEAFPRILVVDRTFRKLVEAAGAVMALIYLIYEPSRCLRCEGFACCHQDVLYYNFILNLAEFLIETN